MTIPHAWIDFILRLWLICAILHTLLPPWDWLNEFPTAQKYYKLLVYIVGYLALHARSTVYTSISTTNGGTNGQKQ